MNISQPAQRKDKDWEAAFAKMSVSMGFTGVAPAIPPNPRPKKTDGRKKNVSKNSVIRKGSSDSNAQSQGLPSKQESRSVEAVNYLICDVLNLFCSRYPPGSG